MAETPTTLVIGGTGKVGSRLVRRLQEKGYTVRIGSRNNRTRVLNASIENTYFDWNNDNTYDAILTGIKRVYLIAPIGVADPAVPMINFIDRAQQAGIERIVLQSSTLMTSESPGLGIVHNTIQSKLPEWAVLRPSWFMQNFSERHYHTTSIRNEGIIVAATGTGKIGFIDAEDIAEVALRALIDEQAHNTDHIITGPQALSYAEVAEILSQTLQRSIRFIDAQPEEAQALMIAYGMPASFAAIMTQVDDTIIRNGYQDFITPTVEQVTGHPARSFAEFAAAYAAKING